jgi:AmmeMemoRadiSam system protein A
VAIAPTISESARQALLTIARRALDVAVGGARPEALRALVDEGCGTTIRAAAFVTLTEGGDLRGCIGTLDADQRLEDAVARATISAATRDPRFRPVAADELPRLRIDISVLGAPAELEVVADFRPGTHGVIVSQGARSALLLPEVAVDHGWDGETMLAAACNKAGLSPDAWRDPRTQRQVFATARFGGPAVEGGGHPR